MYEVRFHRTVGYIRLTLVDTCQTGGRGMGKPLPEGEEGVLLEVWYPKPPQTDGQTDGHTDRQTDRQAGRQTDR